MKRLKTLIMKFGGSSLQDIDHIHKVAQIIISQKKDFDQVIVVASAMGKTTDQLLGMARKVNPDPPKREQDMLLSAGERISMALLAMALSKEGHEAYSFTGSQAGIITCPGHTNARILNVKPHRLLPFLEAQKVLIIAGFQGVSETGAITTLGRGGSDTTAVALGIALEAEKVVFYKDVMGIFESDPNRNPQAAHLPKLSYQEALNVIERGERKVLHPRAVALAEKNNLPLHVLSFIEEGKGSLITGESLERVGKKIYEEHT